MPQADHWQVLVTNQATQKKTLRSIDLKLTRSGMEKACINTSQFTQELVDKQRIRHVKSYTFRNITQCKYQNILNITKKLPGTQRKK